jgi:hypothetical protein
MGIMWRRFLARLVIRIIRRHFAEGISGIVGSHTTWSWSDEFERSVFNRGTPPTAENCGAGANNTQQMQAVRFANCEAQLRLASDVSCNCKRERNYRLPP